MKKLMTILFLGLIATNIAMADTELGENQASDCVSTHQSGRNQQGLASGSEEVEETRQGTSR